MGHYHLDVIASSIGKEQARQLQEAHSRDFRTASPEFVLFYFSTLTPDVQTAICVLKTIVPIRGVTLVRSSTGSVVIEVTYTDSQDNKKAIQEGVKLNGQVVEAYDTLRKSSAITQIWVTRVPHVSDKEIIDVLSSILSTVRSGA
ncbi:hypothetical protein INT44_008027 [Umbelopsis vinacea]|uniref:Uncharacterized protein n=1 Tax=Umbelopsis vinacea TaxID=44442 RepID=A0A8H7U9N9_9FUNG|nr:hypothetical protein INT44_008027 [Umbelopsis vinacea]